MNSVEFLMFLYKKKKCGYSAINTARSALSCLFDNPPMGDNPTVKRLMRSIFNSRPSKPRYNKIWDVSIVLRYLEKKAPAHTLTLKDLTMKLLMLCALVTAQRCQTLQALNLKGCTINITNAVFQVDSVLKHNRPTNNSNEFILPAYPDNKNLCVVTYLRAYIRRTKPFRKSSQLFLSFISPHKPVSKDTISRWIKLGLQKAGINIGVYKAHSTRAASTTAASKDTDIGTIMKTAGWTNTKTFGVYYKKTTDRGVFGKSILDKH